MKSRKVLAVVMAVVTLFNLYTLNGFSTVNMAKATEATINIGDTIQMGSYNGKPIEWVCVLIDDNGPLMLSKKSLCEKEYDAPGEDAFYHSDGWGYIRKVYGSNCWYDSSIRQWLNSSGKVEYTHCPPSYAEENGFLSCFNSQELSCIKSVTQKIYINSWEKERGYISGGSRESDPFYGGFDLLINADFSDVMYQNVTDSIFLLNAPQIKKISQVLPDVLLENTTTLYPGNAGASYENLFSIESGYFGVIRAYVKNAIRPAFYLDLEKIWYNFYRDSFNFENWGEEISLNYYTTLYEEAAGDTLYKAKKNDSKDGLCFGMAVVTANLFNGYPNSNKVMCGSSMNLSIRELDKKKTKIGIGKYELSLVDYIKYGFIYQWSEECQETVDFKELFSNNKLGLIINLIKNEKEAHSVLLVGYNSDYMYVDDPNSKEEMQTISNKMPWTFSNPWSGKVTSENSRLSYKSHPEKVYEALSTGIKLTVNPGALDSKDISSESYISCEKKLGKDTVLCYVDSAEAKVNAKDFVDVSLSCSDSENFDNETSYTLMWIKDQKNINVSNLSKESNDITFALNNTKVDATLTEDSDFSVSLENEESPEIVVKTEKGDNVTFTVSDVGEFDNKRVKISGIATENEISAIGNETSISVSGLDDIEVTYIKNDEEANSIIVPIKDGRKVSISVNSNNDDIKTDFDETAPVVTPETCKCACHDKGFLKIIWFFINLLNKLFKENQYCACGAKHW